MPSRSPSPGRICQPQSVAWPTGSDSGAVQLWDIRSGRELRSFPAAGQTFYVAFSPERVDPGRTDFTLRNTPKIVGGKLGLSPV